MENLILAPSNEVEEKALQVYELLKQISVDPNSAPSTKANAQRALACVWQIVNDLGLVHEQLFEYGI